MFTPNTEGQLNEILGQIRQGKVALFLGAGASHAGGGPTGKKLTEMIKERFPKIDQSLNDFIEVCQYVIDTPPYNRNELEEFIKSNLESLQPSTSHEIMTKYNWTTIFTTNFDDLIELSYRTSTERRQQCQPIYSEWFQVNPSDRNKVFLFKIMGCIRTTENESGQMVLSRADYNRALIRRRKYLELFSDFVKSGTVVFIGYSFSDRLVLDIIDDLIEIYGKDRLPWSYALFDKVEQIDERTQHIFSSRKIIPLECSFEKFFKYLDRNYTVPLGIRTVENVRFKLRGHILEISDVEFRQHAEFFEILNEEKLDQDSGAKDNFYMGTNKSWGAFKEGWDFKRDIYIKHLKDRVFNELKQYAVEANKVLLLTGMAGVGKTILLRRLAWDIYTSGESPVIIIGPTRITFDYKLIASFIEDLNRKLDEKISEGQHTPPIKPLIIIDNAGSLILHVNRLKDYLSSRGRPAIIVAAERTGEWNSKWKASKDGKPLFQIPQENIYELDEQLTGNERNKITDHFYEMGYIQIKGKFWDNIVCKDFENSYFATIYTLVHPSRKPLNDIIRDQYQNLTDLTQKAFQYICCFHQFDLPINHELLERSLGCDYETFKSEVIGKDTAKIIFEEQDETKNLLYRTHHRIIAKKTVEFFFGDPEMQKNIFLEILKKSVLTNRREREICEKLLVEYIGPKSKQRIFLCEQQRQMFRTVCEKSPIRSLVHHWGILEADDYQYLEAERLLKWALNLPKESTESYRGESDQNILTSLGSLYSHRGIDSIKKGDIKEAEQYFEKAEASFKEAKHGEFPNAFAYHSHAYMWYSKGNEQKDDVQKINCYASGLEILSIARDNVNEEELEPIYELETQIWGQIGDEPKITQNLEILRDKFKSPRGYYLNAELLWRKAQDKKEVKEVEERKELSRLALRKVEKGLKFFPNDEHCLRLRSKLLKELEPHDLKKYYDSLQRWKAVATTPNAWLLYELGRVSFILGYYEFAKNFFTELETGVGIGHKLRSRPQHPILDDRGNEKEFEGTIVSIFSQAEGMIRCETLRSLRYPIPFRPVACRFTPSYRDSVKFYIKFSYRGPRAENVRKT